MLIFVLEPHFQVNEFRNQKKSLPLLLLNKTVITNMFDGIKLINTPKHSFKNIKEAKIWAKNNITGVYNNVNTGEAISVSRTAIDKYLSESAIKKSVSLCVHLSALMQIPKLIETSVLKTIKRDRLHDTNINEIRRFYGAIDFDSEIYPVKITVKVIKQGGNKAYSYEVMQIESPITQKNYRDNPF